jgi:hypothetical protein
MIALPRDDPAPNPEVIPMRAARHLRPAVESLGRREVPSSLAVVQVAASSLPTAVESTGVEDVTAIGFYPIPMGPEPDDFDGDDIPFVVIPPLLVGPAGAAF